MRNKQYSRQVDKRKSIGDRTLVVGMDIGKGFNAACFMDKEGNVLGRYPKIYNSRKGFDFFHTMVEQTKRKHKLTHVFIGMEPTGHYWRKIAFFAKEKGYEVRFVRTTAVRHQRELDESSSAKSDIKDAFTIGNIAREGKYIDTVIEESVFRNLRTLAHVREKTVRSSTSAIHVLQAVLDDYFPELRDIFWSAKAKGLMALLAHCPFPEDIRTAGLPVITALLEPANPRRRQAREKAKQIYQAATESVGLTSIGAADRMRLATALEEAMRTQARIKEIERAIKELLKQIPVAVYIQSLPGVGPVSSGIFLGELGNPDYFKHPRQIIKYAGYDPKEDESGLRVGRKIISKKGRWLLRKILFFMTLGVVQHSSFFRAYYEHKKKGIHHPLKKKEALCAVILKLIRVMFALMRDRRMFTEELNRCREAA
jgi:transposase